MTSNFQKDVDFIRLLRENQVTAPNDFTLEMGKLIKKAREEKGLTQAEFAKSINRRPATISHIENGKSEISITTLVLLAIELNRPISYFFPDTIFKDTLLDIQTYELEYINLLREIAQYGGDTGLIFKLLETMKDYYKEDWESFR